MGVVWNARDKSAEALVFACARGEISWDTLSRAFSERGWSTRYLYEAVRNAEYHLEAEAYLAAQDHRP
jgi:hypothetical protein